MSAQSPRPRKPPLTALRAFEAAGRLGGFAPAAQELGVTPGAITAHLKGLETTLGAALFERAARGVRLTALGREVLPDFTAAFDALNAATHRLQAAAAPGRVRIATDPAIAQLWLSPRLPQLRRALADIRVEIVTMDAAPEPGRDGCDLYLFHQSMGARSGTFTLARETLVPVCAPALARRWRGPSDLDPAQCLVDARHPEDWRAWSRVAGRPELAPRGPVLDTTVLCVEEAVNGAGIALSRQALVGRHLADGRLVQPFGPALALDRVMVLWLATGAAPAAGLVAEWLIDA
ncbi:MAG: glycine cleavage system transcriptional activator GcvA [Rhodobacteraceae bacterium HLUCCA12]|nr:MAG: glycine cleavage system transcriptional activator GcvA [Rhodobacteraceae bacterium HLUCCA12]